MTTNILRIGDILRQIAFVEHQPEPGSPARKGCPKIVIGNISLPMKQCPTNVDMCCPWSFQFQAHCLGKVLSQCILFSSLTVRTTLFESMWPVQFKCCHC